MFYVASTREEAVDPMTEPRQWRPAGVLHAAADGSLRTLCGLEVTGLHRFYGEAWREVDATLRCRRCVRSVTGSPRLRRAERSRRDSNVRPAE